MQSVPLSNVDDELRRANQVNEQLVASLREAHNRIDQLDKARSAEDASIYRADRATINMLAAVKLTLERENRTLRGAREVHAAAVTANPILLPNRSNRRPEEVSVLCPICTSRAVDHVIVECGHAFCLRCLKGQLDTWIPTFPAIHRNRAADTSESVGIARSARVVRVGSRAGVCFGQAASLCCRWKMCVGSSAVFES